MKPRLLLLFLIASVLAGLFAWQPWGPRLVVEAEAFGDVAERLKDGRTLYPQHRRWVYPIDAGKAKLNPPSLLWPLPDWDDDLRHDVRHTVELSQDPDFAPERTQHSPSLAWAIWRPAEPLAAGRWYWRYRTKLGFRQQQSATFSFTIDASSTTTPWPTAATMLDRLPEARPRVLLKADQLPDIRKRLLGSDYATAIISQAEQLRDSPLPQKEMLTATGVDEPSKYQKNKLRSDSLKIFGRRVHAGIEPLLQAYLLTGEAAYAERAMEWALAVAVFDRNGPTFKVDNNFGAGALLKAMGLVYDSCHELLTTEQKQQLRTGIRLRMERFLHEEWLNSLEAMGEKGHAWQLLLHDALMAALAVHGDEPAAADWITYFYELWLARFPALGGQDGTWAVGLSYLEHNAETMITVPTLFKELAGIDLFQHPYYGQVARYCTAVPWNPGFCDAPPNFNKVAWNLSAFIRSVQHEHPTPWGAWYLRQHEADAVDWRLRDDRYAWYHRIYRHGPLPACEPIASDRTGDHLFDSTGLAIFHANRPDPPTNLMIAFQSSPIGSLGHAQREQNTFNILFGGEPVFYRTGYRIASGDPHHLLYYTATDSKNGILVDGKGQAEHEDAFGHLRAWGTSERIAYVQGDATHAYNPPMAEHAEKRIRKKGFSSQAGECGLERFDRHLVFLKPDTVIVYDVLAADHAARWSFLLHSHREPSLQPDQGRLDLQGRNFAATAGILGSTPLDWSVTSEIHPAPKNWRAHRDKTGQALRYPPQFHMRFDGQQATGSMRYLAIIRVRGIENGSQPSSFTNTGQGFETADWQIEAVLDAHAEPGLRVLAKDGGAAFSFGALSAIDGSDSTTAEPSLHTKANDGNWQTSPVPAVVPTPIGGGFW